MADLKRRNKRGISPFGSVRRAETSGVPLSPGKEDTTAPERAASPVLREAAPSKDMATSAPVGSAASEHPSVSASVRRGRAAGHTLKRKTTLRGIFLRYFALLSALLLLLLSAAILFYTIYVSLGGIYPANYAEKEIDKYRATLSTVSPLTPDLIPELCDYALFDSDGTFISGSLSEQEANSAYELTASGQKSSDGKFFEVIPRKDELLILRYMLIPQFASPFLRTYLPNPQLLLLIAIAVLMLLTILFVASRFGRALAGRIRILEAAADHIQQQDLTFSISPSGVREIDHVLTSLEELRDALKRSLSEQWQGEQSRREEISALAHDIKTPLTVIRGNAELLAETDQSPEQREYGAYILNEVSRMEHYLQELISLAKAERPSEEVTFFSLPEFTEDLSRELSALAAEKGIKTSFSTGQLPRQILGERAQLYRAVVNLLSNAVDHTPPGGEISLQIKERLLEDSPAKNGGSSFSLDFIVWDSGPGFSSEALVHAADRFYMGDPSRAASGHHGMGLSIAKRVAERHGGSLTLANRPDGGAEVTLTLPFHLN